MSRSGAAALLGFMGMWGKVACCSKTVNLWGLHVHVCPQHSGRPDGILRTKSLDWGLVPC